MDVTRNWMEEQEKQGLRTTLRAPVNSRLSVSPRRVNLVDAVQGDVIHQLFSITNRGKAPVRFKAYFKQANAHTARSNHGFIHYSSSGVMSFPAIACQFSVEFHANVVGKFSNELVVQTETQEICIAFEARVSPQAHHISLFRQCWPDHKVPLHLTEDELEDFKMMPRFPMCYWDFDAEKMVIAQTSSSDRKGRGQSDVHSLYKVDPRRSIEELSDIVEEQQEHHIQQWRASLPFPRRLALFRTQEISGDDFVVTAPKTAKLAHLPIPAKVKRRSI